MPELVARPTVCPKCGAPAPEPEDGELPACHECHVSLATTCHLCERPIQPGGGFPLCRSCEGAARAHGRLLVDEQRYPDPERRHDA